MRFAVFLYGFLDFPKVFYAVESLIVTVVERVRVVYCRSAQIYYIVAVKLKVHVLKSHFLRAFVSIVK